MCRFTQSLAAVVFTLTALASNTQAVPIYDTSAAGELVGMRSVAAGQLIATDSVWDAAVIAWNVVSQPGDLFQYTYTLTGFGGDYGDDDDDDDDDDDGELHAAIRHFDIDISNDVPDGFGGSTDPTAVMDAMFGPDLGSLVPIDPLDVLFGDFGGIIGALKLDVGTETTSSVYQFLSSRSPVYGHVFVKNGGTVTLQNAGLTDPLSDVPGDFIVRPNGPVNDIPDDQILVPEPSTFVLTLLGALALFGYLAAVRRVV